MSASLRAALIQAAADLAHAAEYIAREGGGDRVARSTDVMDAAKKAQAALDGERELAGKFADALIAAHDATDDDYDYAELDKYGQPMQDALIEVRRIIRKALPAGTLEGWAEE